MKMNIVSLCLLAITMSLSGYAQNTLTPRATPIDQEGMYLPVNLSSVMNDMQPFPFPAEEVTCGSVPFNLSKKGTSNCLFLKSIGWSAARDESAEYPGYIANYDNWVAASKDPTRAMVRIPVGDYQAIWLLAAADTDANLSDSVTFRFGMAEGQGPVSWHDVNARIPRANANGGSGVMATIPTAAGNLFLIRIPFAQAIAQDYRFTRSIWLDITKNLQIAVNLPDPYRYQVRPLGAPSGVRIYAMTLSRAPLQLQVTPTEPGNVFNEPQTPAFHLTMNNVLGEHWIPYTIETEAIADDGTMTRQTLKEAFRSVAWVYGNPVLHYNLSVPVPKRGCYQLTISLLAQGQVVNSYKTTFALLAPNTRKYRNESPFGTWDFAGGHVTPSDPDLRGPLYVKAGLRYGMSDQPDTVRKLYGLLPGGDARVRTLSELRALQDQLKADPTLPVPTRFLIFHETGISGPHLTRTPDLFTGRPAYKMSPEEEKTFRGNDVWAQAAEMIPAIRAAFPKAEIYFGNTTPHLLEEFLRHGWPVKDLGTIGNESGSFMRLPETQPTDFIAGNAGMFMMRQIADHYGATKVPLRQCLEICYPGSGPGNLSEMTQAAYLIRHIMHSLAWKIPVIRPMTLTDMGNSYYFSNWGAAGLCHAWPNATPKPAYVAYAVLTQQLDGATFTRVIPTGSTAVYAFEFKKKSGEYVTCIWTVNGKVSLNLKIGVPIQQTDLMGRESTTRTSRGMAIVEASNRPSYLATQRPILAISSGMPAHDLNLTDKSFIISPLDTLDDWTVDADQSLELETYNFLNPRRKGNFSYRIVPGKDGEKGLLEVKPLLPVAGSEYLQMYSALKSKTPIVIPGEPTRIGLKVNGNGGWGRVIFELEDASGQRWISIGAEQAGTPNPWMADWLKPEDFAKLNPKSMNVNDWNSDDAWGRSFINFEGWRLLTFPLPGQYPGEGYHWPMNSQWRFSGDGIVHYPLTFKRLVITMPEKVLYGTQYIRPARYEIELKDLMVIYTPAEKAFEGF